MPSRRYFRTCYHARMTWKPTKLLDPATARKSIEGTPDVLTRDLQHEAALYGAATCPGCGHVGARKVVRATPGADGIRSPFTPGRNLANGHARCLACDTEYSVGTGVILSTPVPFLTGV